MLKDIYLSPTRHDGHGFFYKWTLPNLSTRKHFYRGFIKTQKTDQVIDDYLLIITKNRLMKTSHRS